MILRANRGTGFWNCAWLSRRQVIQRAAAAASFSAVAESFAERRPAQAMWSTCPDDWTHHSNDLLPLSGFGLKVHRLNIKVN
jgi:hypothetical protein